MSDIRSQMRFSAGSVIVEEDPYACCLDQDLIGIMCSYCIRKRPGVVCSRCNVVKYCNTECEMKDKAYHDLECRVLRSCKNEQIPDEESRLVVRTLDRCIRERNEGFDSVGDFFGCRRTIHNLQSHAEDLNASKREKTMRRANCIFDLVKDHIETTPEQVFDILLKCRINKTPLIDHNSPRFYSCGSALYLAVSKMNHSCVEASYIQIFDGRKYTLRALRDVDVGDPLSLTVHYVPPNMPFSQRQKHLLHNYYFICNCAKCCWQARHPVTEADETVASRIEKTFQTAPDYSAWYSIGRELLAKLEHLPDRNFYVNWLLAHMQWTCAMLGRLEESIYYGTRALRGTDVVTTIETILYNMCDALVKLGWHKPDSKKEAAFGEAMKLAKELFMLTHGRDHKLYRALESMQKSGEESSQYGHQAGDYQRGGNAGTLARHNASLLSHGAARPGYGHQPSPLAHLFGSGSSPWMSPMTRPLASTPPSLFPQMPHRWLTPGNGGCAIPRCPSVHQSHRFSPNVVGSYPASNPLPMPIRQLS